MTDRDISNLDEDTQKYIRELREEAKNRRLEVSELTSKLTERDTVVSQANTKLDELTQRINAAQEITNKYTTLQEEHAQALAASAQTELQLARINAARAAELPLDFADRLQGDSPDALKADAAAFKQSLGNSGVSHATGDRTNTTGAAAPLTEHEGLTQAIARHFAEQGE
jgi:hypothetical protein